MATATGKSSSRGDGQPARPLFYGRPIPIAPESFRGKSLALAANFAFARNANAIPLNAAEFPLAQRHYPIAFARDGQHLPCALVGLRKDENLFVGADGRWRGETYVPAYVRRYPFILMRKPDATQFLLGADIESAFVVEGSANPFFKDGKPVEAVNKAANFCRAFQAEAERTGVFCAALTERDLFQSRVVELGHPSGRKIKLGQFNVVDEKKVAALPDATVTDWHRRGWLALVHAHWFSLANLQTLASRLPET
jgi:hypothetical protein